VKICCGEGWRLDAMDDGGFMIECGDSASYNIRFCPYCGKQIEIA